MKSIVEFDDLVTAPIHGFAGAADYYAQCSSGPRLGQIRRPTLLLSSLDDPLVAPSGVPALARENPCLSVIETQSGGHVGFVAGHNPLRPAYYLEQRAGDFLAREIQD